MWLMIIQSLTLVTLTIWCFINKHYECAFAGFLTYVIVGRISYDLHQYTMRIIEALERIRHKI